MEKGCFQNVSNSDSPSKLDLSKLPTEILHSCAVESLIEQNEDLMVRLKVSIRRSSLLEQSLHKNEEDMLVLRKQLTAIKDQLLIWKQKETAWHEKHQNAAQELSRVRVEAELTQMRYAELYSNFQEKRDLWEEENSKLRNRLNQLVHYRRRILKWVRPTFKNKQQLDYKAEIKTQYATIKELEQKLENLNQELTEFRRDNNPIDTIRRLEKEIASLNEKNESLHTETRRIKVLIIENESLRNSLIESQRIREEIKRQSEEEIAQIQERMAFFRAESKKFSLENEQLADKIIQLEEKNKIIEAHQQRMDIGFKLGSLSFVDKQEPQAEASEAHP